MKLCLYLFLFCFVSTNSTSAPSSTVAHPNICHWFEEEDFKVESFKFVERESMWKINLLKRIEWSLLRGIRGPRAGRRIDSKSLANLASTFLPDPGSRFVEDISRSFSTTISSGETNRTTLWNSILDYQNVLRGFSPAIREIVYAKLAMHIRSLIANLNKEFTKDRRNSGRIIAAIRERKKEVVKCFEETNAALETAMNLYSGKFVKFALVQSRIELVRSEVKKFSPHSVNVRGANRLTADAERLIRKNVEGLVSMKSTGEELKNWVGMELKKMGKFLSLSSGDLGLVYLKVIDEFAQFVASVAEKKLPGLERDMNNVQGLIDRNKSHLDRLKSFYA